MEVAALRFPLQKSIHPFTASASPSLPRNAGCLTRSSTAISNKRLVISQHLFCTSRKRKHLSRAGKSKMPEFEFDGSEEEDHNDDEELEEALQMDGKIPDTSEAFVKQVSSKAYDLRRRVNQSLESSSYDVLDANPWKEDSKAVYVLAQGENQLWTMRTRRMRSEVEQELGLLFPRQGSKRHGNGQRKNGGEKRFPVLVEDVREGVLVFEDEKEAINYCNLLDRQSGKGCAGIAEINASSVFDLCRKMNALAVLFRRGRRHPLPEHLEQDLRSRKRSLEDQV
eukprot:TRINITY_DN4095_c0_g1_i1.p1 TRINITY_DN4095_c0_g1~~TRINITY_DN4095_c0_g1_i1.p1  ORF type:complete len:282 (+),score=62.92 TRINITY_DN4095_c0_g1_i1:71-916(+)